MTNLPFLHKIYGYVSIRLSVSEIMESVLEIINTVYLEVYTLANIKSAKKRILVIQTKTLRNKAIRSRVKTSIKKVDLAIAEGDKAAAVAALNKATSELNKAASKGVFHKNTVSRKISRLTQAVNKLA